MHELFKTGNRNSNNWNIEQYSQSVKETSGF